MAGLFVIRAAALMVAALTLAPPARADVAEAVNDVILPAYDRLAASSAALASAAAADCRAEGLREAYQAAWDDWARIGFLHLGPVENDGRALAIAFWPDTKSSGSRAQQALIDADAPAIDDPAGFADLSVAIRGLAGLERLLYPSTITGDEAVLCRLRQATAADLARMTAAIRTEWTDFAPALLEPGAAGNSTYLTQTEAQQAIFTQIMAGLEYDADTRLGRPLGTFDKPYPERAEAIAAGRSLRNLTLSLQEIRALAMALFPQAATSGAAFDRAIALGEGLEDPVFATVSDPQGRLKVEILQQSVRAARDTVKAEIGGALGLSMGFNSQDGD